MFNSRLRGGCLLASCVASLVVGCVSTRDIQPQNPLLAADKLQTRESLTAARVDSAAWPVDRWWELFNDAQLNTLINRALADSPSLQIARARIEQARAIALSLDSERKVQAALNFDSTAQRYPENYLIPPPLGGSTSTEARLALDFSYEFDFWGRQAQASKAAAMRVDAATAQLAAARLMLAVSVVQTYLQYGFRLDVLGVANENLSQKDEIYTLTKSRFASGVDSTVQLKQAESSLATARFGVEYAQADLEVQQEQLASLIGAGPDAGLHLTPPHMASIEVPALPSILPLDLIARRPDIRVLKLQIDAATHDLAAARASAYPNVNLAAFAGVQSLGLGNLLESGSRTYGIGPAVHLPIFDGGRVRAGVLQASGNLDETIGQYNEAILQAVREVAQQVSGLRSLQRQREQQRVAQAAAEEAYRLAELRFKEGIDNYLTLLSAQSSVLMQHFLAAQLDSRERDLAVNLIRALGGGYDPQHPAS